MWPHRWQLTRLHHPWDSPGKNTGVGCISFSNAWKWKWSRSVVSNSARHHDLHSTRLLHPWGSPGNSPGVGKEISSLSHSIVFLYFALFFEKRTSYCSLLFSGPLHPVGYIFLLPCFSLLFVPQLFVKSPQTTTLPSCISFLGGGWFWSLLTLQCYKPLVYSSSNTLSTRSSSSNLFAPSLYNHKGFDLSHTWMV